MAASPVGPRSTRSFWFVARNYALDVPDASFLDFEAAILEQDKPIVESQRPEELPIDLSAELHIKGIDRVALEYRRWLLELVNSDEPTPHREALSAGGSHGHA
jgi:phenylpropionate dioxygenase-like ring-hydroxylating dioxygenase large terminal subunit